MAKSVSQSKLDKLRREWQKTLRLQDWKIKIGLVDLAFLKEVTGTFEPCGACECLVEAKQARIHILRPEDWGENADERTQDVENTVVHELLHCHFAPFEAKAAPTRLQHEQAIEAITDALLMLKRGKRDGKSRKAAE